MAEPLKTEQPIIENKNKFPLNKLVYGMGVSAVEFLKWAAISAIAFFPLAHWGRQKSEYIDKFVSFFETINQRFHFGKNTNGKSWIAPALLSLGVGSIVGHAMQVAPTIRGYAEAKAAENQFNNLGEQVTSLTEKHIIDSQEIARLNEKVAELQKTRPSHTEQIAQEKAIAGANAQHHQ